MASFGVRGWDLVWIAMESLAVDKGPEQQQTARVLLLGQETWSL